MSAGGMSGGAVLDGEGRLIGINTGAENEIEIDEEGKYSEFSLGFSLGEAIIDVFGYLQTHKPKLKEDWLKIDTNPATKLTDAEVKSIENHLLTTIIGVKMP